MEIKNVRVRETENTITLLADCKIRTVGWDKLYFTIDKKYRRYLYEDASSFAAALLIPSMYLGQDLVIRGSVSRTLYKNMYQVMKTINGWWPFFKPIQIKAGTIIEDTAHPKNVGMFFSGGVDSFYTYLKHKSDKKDPISQFILINGSDIELRNKTLWRMTQGNIEEIARKENIAVIVVETNAQSIIEPIVLPDYTHGGSLAGIGLCLRAGLKKIYIGASFNTEEQVPYGSHPDLDKYWGTEVIAFEHDGGESNRFQKLERQVARSPLALAYLRVCYMNKNGKYNCGKCEKCMRTMVSLYALGKLNDAKTFPHTIDLERLTTLIAHQTFSNAGHRENLAALRERNLNPAMQAAIEKGVATTVDPTRDIKEPIIKKIIYLDHMYLRGKLFKIWLSVVHPLQ